MSKVITKSEGARRRRRAGQESFEAVMKAAERSGLLKDQNGCISSRVSRALVRQAKKRTGIAADSDLIAFALASVALDGGFAEAFRKSRGKVDVALNLGF